MKSAPGLFSRRILKQGVPALILALIVSTLSIAADPSWLAPARAAGPCDAPVVSKVACENTLPGSPASEWQVAGAGSSTIQGYATSMSVNVGQAVTFKVKTTSSAYRIDIYRLGYYQGLGARKVASNILPSVPLPQSQPNCLTFSATGLIDCGNWAVSASWQVPATAVSGVYLARLVRTDVSAASVIPFVVRDDAAHSDLLFQTADSTWQAYNTYGGNSLYGCTVACPPGNPQAYKAAFKVSYNRPFTTGGEAQGQNWLMYAEYPMIRFIEANGYDVSYMSGLDVSTKAPLLLNHKAFLSVGHDEYWTAEQRANVEAARDAGVHLAFFSGNEIFWKTRWESSSAGTVTPNRTVASYKDTHFNGPVDPVSWTGTWRDPRYGTATGGGNPENSLTGQYFVVNSGTTDIEVPAAYKQLRLWRNTSIPSLASGASATLGDGAGTLGYEWDIDADNGFRPPGQFRLSHTTSTTAEIFTDYGSSTQQGGTATHNLTMYKANSGALVFGAGTIQWSWGLDSYTTGKSVDRDMQQATVNLFADMGSQPTTLISGLVSAQPSADTAPPTSAVTSPAAGAAVADGTLLTVSGTASDTGGVVAGVEVSTDGGTTWRRANGTTNWSYSWNAHGSPTSVLRSRAVDDSGNLESGSTGVPVSITCPCSLSGLNVAPVAPDSGDTGGIEVGAKFYSDVAGTVSSVRFFKSAKNTGTHIGSVWSAAGQRLASATFTSETATGWQTATLSPPLAITANTHYVVSYFAPAGHYAQDLGYFYNNPSPTGGRNQLDSAPLHFTRSLPGSPNGFYRYGSTSSFPNQVFDAEYYWVDVSFTPSGTVLPAVSSVSPVNNATGVAVSTKPAVTFNQAVTASSVVFELKNAAGATVGGSLAYDAATNTSTFTPSSALGFSTSYTATVSGARNSAG
ncbi:MAG TPA: N,N-dimethylformamidase beta subunit family domain-containing protein, partial [Arthrobacter sp.]|nr:N,N-dimethylformamidase beta subunit family domain-containing protein [Arthrobacter sp.]